MSYIALLWKARTIEKYRLNYEQEKYNSIKLAKAELPKLSMFQKLRHYRYDTRKKAGKWFQKCCPEGSKLGNFILNLKTDQTFPNFVMKSVLGFVGGIVLTYCCFMFFVFQLAISLVHATIMSCIIGILLTLGLAFSYRIRCLVFLLIPQFFSRVGRYTLTCYALVLVLTGPATNTLRNSEVLSESMACGQEQVKTSVRQITESIKKPFNSMKESIKLMIDKVKQVAVKLKETLLKVHRLVLSIVRVLQSAFSWLSSIVGMCNKKVGTPYVRCTRALNEGVLDCQARLGPYFSWLCNVVYVAHVACWAVKPLDVICILVEFVSGTIVTTIKRKLRSFSNHVKTMLFVSVHVHHSYSFSSNSSKSASQVAAGIVTEIRHRAEPLLTWLSWSSCVTSLFLLLIIFRAKYYQHMYETRSRFDNRYITYELRYLDLKRVRENRDTVLPLNRRERAKYITTTSFRLLPSEKLYLARSLVFMCITTFKLLIHVVADYSLYWVLMTIRRHGRFQTPQLPGIPDAGVEVAGSGPVAGMMRSLVDSLSLPLASSVPSPVSCLPNPYPPDLQRYTQIGVLIFLLWFLSIFEPYGLRLRHVIMGHYRPERAKARAVWLYNHILRTRGGFLKLARRKLHRNYKYSTEEKFTFRQWLDAHIPCWWLRSLLGTSPKEPHCLLCGTTETINDPDTQLIRCTTPNCPGIYCTSCFSDIGQLCTICLSPADYGDLSDISLEKGSSEDSSSDNEDLETDTNTKSFKSEHEDDRNSDSTDDNTPDSPLTHIVDEDVNTSSTIKENDDTSKSSNKYKTSSSNHSSDSNYKRKKQDNNNQNDKIVNFAFNISNKEPNNHNKYINTNNKDDQEIKCMKNKMMFKKRKNSHNIFENLCKLFRCPYFYTSLNTGNRNRKIHRLRKIYRKRTRRRKKSKALNNQIKHLGVIDDYRTPNVNKNAKKSKDIFSETVNNRNTLVTKVSNTDITGFRSKAFNNLTVSYMTQDEWIQKLYNKEVGLDKKEMDDSLFNDTINQLEKVANKMKKQTKDIVTITDNSPQIHNIDWRQAPKPLRCACPVTKCTCVGRYVQSAAKPIPKRKNLYRGIAKYFISYVYKKKNFTPPNGTFIKELEAALNQEVVNYNKIQEEGILKSQGPEDCFSKCPHFYRSRMFPKKNSEQNDLETNRIDAKANLLPKEVDFGDFQQYKNNDVSQHLEELKHLNSNDMQDKIENKLEVENNKLYEEPTNIKINDTEKSKNFKSRNRKKECMIIEEKLNENDKNYSDNNKKSTKELKHLNSNDMQDKIENKLEVENNKLYEEPTNIKINDTEKSKNVKSRNRKKECMIIEEKLKENDKNYSDNNKKSRKMSSKVKDEASFQDLVTDKPLSDGITFPGSTQSCINSEQIKSNNYENNNCRDKSKAKNIILKDTASQVASVTNSCSTDSGFRQKLHQFCNWLFGYNSKVEKEVEAIPECHTFSSQYIEEALTTNTTIDSKVDDCHSLEMAQNNNSSKEIKDLNIPCQSRQHISKLKPSIKRRSKDYNSKNNVNGTNGIKLDIISEKNRLHSRQLPCSRLSITEISDSCTSPCVSSDWWSPLDEKKNCIKNGLNRKVSFL